MAGGGRCKALRTVPGTQQTLIITNSMVVITWSSLNFSIIPIIWIQQPKLRKLKRLV